MKIIIRADHVHIEGYVNAVERLSKPITERLGTFRERVMAGTFKKALKKAQDVRILLNHNEDRDLGGIKDGNLKLEEDSIGLRAEADIFDKDVIADAKAGNLVGWSFGFFPIESRDTSEDGMPIKELHEIDLREVSLLNKRHTPAYDGTLVAVRDYDEKMIIGETMLAEAVDIKEETENQDETINEALAEIREKSSDEKAQDEKPENKTEVSSEYFAGYKTMIAEMKA